MNVTVDRHVGCNPPVTATYRRYVLPCALLLLGLAGAKEVEADLRIKFDEQQGTVSVVRNDGQNPILTQHARHNFRPYLHPIVAPDGQGELTEYSPGHHKHQTGLYWGFTRVNGRDYFHHPEGDYWRRKSIRVLKANGPSVSWRTAYDLLDADGGAVLTETQTWEMRTTNREFLLDLTWQGTAHVDVTIGEYKYGGLFLRMPWRKGMTGAAVNAAGQKNSEAEGQRDVWVDVGMQVAGRDDLAHIAIFDHPDNTGFPLPWRVDGQMGVGPVRARLGDWTIPKGESETIRHRIFVYTGTFSNLRVNEMWSEYTGLTERPSVGSSAASDRLTLLVRTLGDVKDPAVQTALMKGMLDGLAGRRNVTPPSEWAALSARFDQSDDARLRELSQQLSQLFGDRKAAERALARVQDRSEGIASRRLALRSLLSQQSEEASDLLESLMAEPQFRLDAIRGYAAVENAAAPAVLLSRYPQLSPDHRRAVVETLATRKPYVEALLEAVKQQTVSRDEIPAHVARSLYGILGNRFIDVFGDVQELAPDREKLMAKYKKLITPEKLVVANASRGRAVFKKTCAACHVLYDDGGKIGPDLTGSNRANLDYVLLNSVDPSYDVPDAYKTVSVVTDDGRVVNGVLAEEDASRIVLKTVEQPRLIIAKENIEERVISPKSMMPDGQLEKMTRQEVIDLIKYLRTTQQVEIAQ